MLVFGPYRAVGPLLEEGFTVFNLSSQTEAIARLPGLFVLPTQQPMMNMPDGTQMAEKSFDMWYYQYLIEDTVACSSLMMILNTLNNTGKVFICITDYGSNDAINVLNECFMKFIQARYDIKYSIINEAEDYFYIPKDGCDFMSVSGINAFDEDVRRFMYLSEAQRIMSGGAIPDQY